MWQQIGYFRQNVYTEFWEDNLKTEKSRALVFHLFHERKYFWNSAFNSHLYKSYNQVIK